MTKKSGAEIAETMTTTTMNEQTSDQLSLITPEESESGTTSEKIYYRIGDVAELLGIRPYVLRYWETEFSVLHPSKSSTGQRVYRKADVDLLKLIQHLLYTERYSIEGARKRIRELKKQGELEGFVAQKIYGQGTENPLERKARLEEILVEVKALNDFASTAPSWEIGPTGQA